MTGDGPQEVPGRLPVPPPASPTPLLPGREPVEVPTRPQHDWRLVMLAGLWFLRPGFTGVADRRWWTVALAIQFFHHVERIHDVLSVGVEARLRGDDRGLWRCARTNGSPTPFPEPGWPRGTGTART